jgi:hypothetical protein
MVPKGVWYYMARLASDVNPARDWIVKSWLARNAPKHPQLEFQSRGGELWAKWLVGVNEERERGIETWGCPTPPAGWDGPVAELHRNSLGVWS